MSKPHTKKTPGIWTLQELAIVVLIGLVAASIVVLIIWALVEIL